MMDKQTVLEACNRVADVADLPFYAELVDALRGAMVALTASEPTMKHYPEAVARHEKAIRDAKSCIKRIDQDAT
ncbi:MULTISPECIES: hypothetical protein [Burkholderia]|uniref:Uncharacterized protein n=1 Tax=Burkholderia pseudomallei (strain K96243) TaxID=272560 RepID=Q63N98_BURPS|nr:MULTISPECIES: hypothetical protein [Burkholderia]ALB96014.1 hypothetical protein AM256_20240 [Burkholderia pseudomallei]ALC02073.1 hypothetical protein AM257_20265 [Burkholderia pseudomallei]ANW52249.1 hypothetical protein A7U58_18810 [Burkholderia pseudomallei]ANW58235.1 hypothetical protein A7U59_18765 [Burkholderia pseudomallei]ARK71133.1 hypothetical protein BOC38_32210 [Burkholderia pseudomallei]